MLYLVALQLAKAKKPSEGRDREMLDRILQLMTVDLFSGQPWWQSASLCRGLADS